MPPITDGPSPNFGSNDSTPAPAEGNTGISPLQLTADVVSTGMIVFQISRRILTSLAVTKIDVNAYTVCLGIGHFLKWPDSGKARFQQAKSSLKSISTWEKVVKFGFNMNGPFGDLLGLANGERFAALSACLTEIYFPSVVANIFILLAQKLEENHPTEKYLKDCHIPSVDQMCSVVERFAGLWATSEFSTLVEEHMSKDGQASVIGAAVPKKKIDRKHKFRSCAYPQFIADALYELLMISNDSNIEQVLFAGGADAIAIGAIGHWLLDLPTRIGRSLTVDGELTSDWEAGSNAKRPRVEILLLTDMEKPIEKKCTIVRLHQMTEVIKENRSFDAEKIVAARVKWDQAFSKTFPDCFETLMDRHIDFGKALGSAARIFEAITRGDEEVPKEWLPLCRSYFEHSFGLDFVFFALERFPELEGRGELGGKMRAHMNRCAQQPSFLTAVEDFEQSMINLKVSCKCKRICQSLLDQVSADAQTGERRQLHCLPALACTIIRLAREMSGVDVENESLCLKRSGIQWFYEQQEQRHLRQKQASNDKTNTNIEKYIWRLLDFVRADKSTPDYSRLAVVHSLFTGKQRHSKDDDVLPEISAYREHGICCFYKILIEPSRDAAKAARIGVIPGTIESQRSRKRQQTVMYDFIQDPQSGSLNPYKNTHEYQKSENRPALIAKRETMDLARSCIPGSDLKFVIRENFEASLIPARSALEIGIEIPTVQGQGLECLGPATALKGIVQGTGITVSCMHDGLPDEDDRLDDTIRQAMPQGSPANGYIEMPYGGREIIIFRGDPVTTFIASAGCWLPLILRNENCVKCAIETGIKNSWQSFAIVCSEESWKRMSLMKPAIEEGSQGLRTT